MKFIEANFIPNHYCFLIGSRTIGGQATLIERKTRFLLSKNLRVTILAMRGPTEVIFKETGANVHFINELDLGLEQLLDKGHDELGKHLAATLFSDSTDKVFFETYTLLDLYLAAKIASHTPTSKIGHYLINSKDINRIPTRELNGLITSGILYAMNDQCCIDRRITKLTNQEFIPTIPLPIENNLRKAKKLESPSPVVLTICRAEKTKEYVVGLIKAIEDLLAEYPDISLRIVGDGDRLEDWKKHAYDSEARANITFLGTLLRDDLERELSLATVYVGMGTTLLLAVNAEIPSIAVIPWTSNAKSYGFFSELPFGNLGEVIANDEAADVTPMLRRLLSDLELRNNEIINAKRRLDQEFSIDSSMQRFTELAEKIPKKLLDFPPVYYPTTRLMLARALFKCGLLRKNWIRDYFQSRNKLQT